MLTRQIWEDPFLKGTKIICLVRQDLKIWSKNTKLNLSMIASVSFSNKLMLKDWIYRTLNTDILNLDKTSSSTRRIIDEGKGSPRYSNPKYARTGRNEKGSRTTSWWSLIQKLRENHETIQKLTSQLQEMQEQMNSMNDSGNFQITVGDCLTYPVSLQWFQVLVPCWAATNACFLTHGIHRDYRKTFLVINVPRLIHSEIILKEFNLAHHKENENQFHRPQCWRLFFRMRWQTM